MSEAEAKDAVSEFTAAVRAAQSYRMVRRDRLEYSQGVYLDTFTTYLVDLATGVARVSIYPEASDSTVEDQLELVLGVDALDQLTTNVVLDYSSGPLRVLAANPDGSWARTTPEAVAAASLLDPPMPDSIEELNATAFALIAVTPQHFTLSTHRLTFRVPGLQALDWVPMLLALGLGGASTQPDLAASDAAIQRIDGGLMVTISIAQTLNSIAGLDEVLQGSTATTTLQWDGLDTTGPVTIPTG